MRRSFRGVLDQRAVADGEGLVGVGHELRVVGREDEGGARFRLHAAHELDDRGAGVGVEVGGRLVGEHDLRRLDERARDRHALLLAAGELVRPVVRVRGEADRLEQRVVRWRRSASRRAHQQQRVLDVLVGRQHRDRLKVWKMKPMFCARKSARRVVVEAPTSSPHTSSVPARRRVDAADQVEQRGLAAARGADHHREAVGRDVEADAAQAGTSTPRRCGRSWRRRAG